MNGKKEIAFEQMVQENLAQAAPYAICPLDGRYVQVATKLFPYFSEYALVKNRVWVEVQWLRFLVENLAKDSKVLAAYNRPLASASILGAYMEFDENSFTRVKEIESQTNHDVKAVELFIAEKLKKQGMQELVSYVHFGCTSEDINNTAYAIMLKRLMQEVWIPTATNLVEAIRNSVKGHEKTPMLAHTHGQPATPTTVGKEMAVYVQRFLQVIAEVERICKTDISAKFNGATGNYSAVAVAFPQYNWPILAAQFVVDHLNLKYNPVTTQIEPHDYICRLADAVRHFNNILLDMDLDMWLYISKEYFKQIPVENEVGSSTMPHKVNPIRFENSEANCDISNALLTALSNKLARSRMQRDLSDSSSMRNIGMALGYSIQAIEQTIGGLKKVAVNEAKLLQDLDEKWEVLAEPIQTILRKNGIPDAYDQLKKLTRGKGITQEAIQKFVSSLKIPVEDKQRLMDLTPATYIGRAEDITGYYLYL